MGGGFSPPDFLLPLNFTDVGLTNCKFFRSRQFFVRKYSGEIYLYIILIFYPFAVIVINKWSLAIYAKLIQSNKFLYLALCFGGRILKISRHFFLYK